MAVSYYKGKYGRTFTPGQGLPVVSTELDSVRNYQFEVQFKGLPGDITNSDDLTLAAKRIQGLSMTNEPITVNRVNDKLYYPGKSTPGELQIEFDNLYLRETSSDLWKFFKHTYDPITGEISKRSLPGGDQPGFKVNTIEIIQLDNSITPHSVIEVYGAFAVGWTASEFNYSTSEFHTITVNFRYDFMNTFNYSNPD